MADPPETTGQHEPSEQPLLRLVPEHELDRLRAERDHLSETVEELEAENQMLRVEIAALERKLEQKDAQRQQVIDSYERVIASKECERTDSEKQPSRFRLTDRLLGRSGGE